MELPPPPSDYHRRMPPMEEARQLVAIGQDAFGRELRLTAEAASVWSALRQVAEQDGVRLLPLSGFRSIERQTEIIRNKLSAGQTRDAILRVNAYPGFSERHTGRALDLGSPDCLHFSEVFAATREFAWLDAHAARFGFSLSYPRGNSHGIAYEPWHWCLKEAALSGAG
jgi:D-alanyl-D-alanine carboxypeptidase